MCTRVNTLCAVEIVSHCVLRVLVMVRIPRTYLSNAVRGPSRPTAPPPPAPNQVPGPQRVCEAGAGHVLPLPLGEGRVGGGGWEGGAEGVHRVWRRRVPVQYVK